MQTRGLLACAALALGAAAPAAAQVPLTPRALGMGGAYVAAARGQESLFLNPANIALPNTPHWSFGIPALGVGADVLGLSVGDVRDLVHYDKLSDAERQDILNNIPGTGTEVRADIRAPLVAAQIRHFALGVSYNTLGSHTLGREFVDLLINGFQPQPGRYDINPAETQGFRATYWDFAGAYAHRFGAVSVGATGHYYLGRGLSRAGIVDVDTVYTALIPSDIRVTYQGVRSTGGNGFGLDLGAAAQPVPGLTVSASVSNVLNTFEWSSDLEQDSVILSRSDYESGDIGNILDRFDANASAYNEAAAPAALRALAADLGRDTDLPRTLRAGASYQAATNTTVSAAYQTNLDSTRVGGVWQKSLGLGVQQRLAFLALRAGVSTNLDSGMLLSGGASLGPLHFGIAHVSDGSVQGFDRTGWIATFGLGTSSQSTMH